MKAIAGVPESLTREQYVSLVESVGFEAKHLRSLVFKTDGIYAVVMDVNAEGRHYIVPDTDDLAVNRVFIPVAD